MPAELARIPTDRLIDELEWRERNEPGEWTAYQARRIADLAKKLNPEPINP